MTTRAFIAKENSNGTFSVTHTNYDGYPEWMLTNLITLMNENGKDNALNTIFAHREWDMLNTDQKDLRNVKFDASADWSTYKPGTPEFEAWRALRENAIIIPGYGKVYGDNDAEAPEVSFMDLFADKMWNEWGYVIKSDGSIDVYHLDYKPDNSKFRLVGTEEEIVYSAMSKYRLGEMFEDVYMYSKVADRMAMLAS